MLLMKNSNRCDEILVWNSQWNGMEIINGTRKGMGIKPAKTGSENVNEPFGTERKGVQLKGHSL